LRAEIFLKNSSLWGPGFWIHFFLSIGWGASQRPVLRVKETLPQDFRLQFFFMDQFPPSPLSITLVSFQIFRKFSEIFATHSALTPVANVKIFNLKSVIIFYEHLRVVELTYRKKISFRFFFRCQQSDIVPRIICHRRQICCLYHWHRWCTLTCEYLRKFAIKFEMTLTLFQGLGGRWFIKNLKQKILRHCPFNILKRQMYALSKRTHSAAKTLHWNKY
jgi:hypothetical protein